MDKKYRRLLSNTAILALGTIGSKLLVFLLLPLYTRCLTKAEYGISDIITQSANFLMPIMSLGISDAVFRYTLDKTVDRRRVLTTGFFVNIACAAVILAILSSAGFHRVFRRVYVAHYSLIPSSRIFTRSSLSMCGRGG